MDHDQPSTKTGTRFTAEQLATALGVSPATLLTLARRFNVGEVEDDGTYAFDTLDAAELRELLPHRSDLPAGESEEHREQ